MNRFASYEVHIGYFFYNVNSTVSFGSLYSDFKIFHWTDTLSIALQHPARNGVVNEVEFLGRIPQTVCHRGSGTPESNPLGIFEPLQCFWYPPTNRKFGSLS